METAKPMTKDDLEDLIGWLGDKPSHAEYQWGIPGTCLLAQYMKDKGFKLPYVLVTSLSYEWENGRIMVEMPEEIQDIANLEPRTYGDALRRAIAFRSKF